MRIKQPRVINITEEEAILF